jgi:flagellar basal-body rod protein FlgB
MDLFSLASAKISWLAASEAIVSRNVAQASTPGFMPRSIGTIQDAMAISSRSPSVTDARHIAVAVASDAGNKMRAGIIEQNTLSGNSVVLEAELARGAAISRDHALATSVIRAFHQMTLSSSK